MLEEFLTKAKERLQREVTDIENRTDLTDEKKVSQIVLIFSTVCAGIAVQPIPFADFFSLTPLQAFMATRISAIRGMPLSEKEAGDIIKEVIGVIGMGMLAQQLGIAAAKIFFPIFGGIATVPVVFGLTYAIGQVMDLYFVHRAQGKTLSPEALRDAWKRAKSKGEKEGRMREAEIKRDAAR